MECSRALPFLPTLRRSCFCAPTRKVRFMHKFMSTRQTVQVLLLPGTDGSNSLGTYLHCYTRSQTTSACRQLTPSLKLWNAARRSRAVLLGSMCCGAGALRQRLGHMLLAGLGSPAHLYTVPQQCYCLPQAGQVLRIATAVRTLL